ncbi:MAG: hypothetical protein KJN63_01850, partial [Acidimicrobiia bacterium]|nr:hypothetical protein [Acidimicrobiia bacterium]
MPTALWIGRVTACGNPVEIGGFAVEMPSRTELKHPRIGVDELTMGKGLVGLLGALILCFASCAVEEDSAPTFRVTSPTLASTSTTAPSTLEYLGLPDLSGGEVEMCDFIERVSQDLKASDERSRNATWATEE